MKRRLIAGCLVASGLVVAAAVALFAPFSNDSELSSAALSSGEVLAPTVRPL